jgi:hypothetical protein
MCAYRVISHTSELVEGAFQRRPKNEIVCGMDCSGKVGMSGLLNVEAIGDVSGKSTLSRASLDKS